MPILMLSCLQERDSIVGINDHLTGMTYTFRIDEDYKHHDDAEKPSIRFAMQTDSIFRCANFKIITDTERTGNQIDVDILGITLPGEICATALGPARMRQFMHLSPGEYRLNISQNGVSDVYKVTVTNEKISVQPQTSNFTRPEFQLYWRYPANSFVYLCGTNRDNTWLCGDFMDSLQTHLSLETIVFPGSGRIAYPIASQGHYYDMSAQYFYYEDEADFHSAGDLLSSYVKSRFPDTTGNSISLISWKNERYHSWLMD